MKNIRLLLTLFVTTMLLASCGDRPFLYLHDDDNPDYAKSGKSTGKAASREPLDVPPELRAKLELPGAEIIASNVDEKVLPKKYQEAVAGKSVSLDARMYTLTPAEVFSGVVDAMTSLNMPVDSVDSPSGIITSDWIRRGAHSMNIFGGTSGTVTRHRFIVRVYRAVLEGKQMTKLEIRVLGQVLQSRRWVNRPIERKVSKELFGAVEEQLTRMKATVLPIENSN
jgi:predicted small lipoprotein YifL